MPTTSDTLPKVLTHPKIIEFTASAQEVGNGFGKP
jgi:hypothetical protein